MKCENCKYFKEHEERNRQTGRTFRSVLKALYDASEGKKVAFFTYNMDYAKNLYRKAFEVANIWGANFTISRNIIKFPNDGEVRFLSINEHEKLRGLRFNEIIYDHCVGFSNNKTMDIIKQYERDLFIKEKEQEIIEKIRGKYTFKDFNFKIY